MPVSWISYLGCGLGVCGNGSYQRAELISLTLQMTAAQIYCMTAKLPFILEFLYRLEIFFQQAQLAG